MRFWDSSALVPLVVEERRSKACRALRRSDASVTVWAFSELEVRSALHRLVRERELDRDELKIAVRRTEAMFSRFHEVGMLDVVRDRASRLLGGHPLTAADSLQLAAALIVAGERVRQFGFVTADDRLATAAEAEGFDVFLPGKD
jgi:predicted nucleic acid-binding protein